MYVDDVKNTMFNENDCNYPIQQDIDDINAVMLWAKKWQLTISFQKIIEHICNYAMHL